jgi:hypothetical protein
MKFEIAGGGNEIGIDDLIIENGESNIQNADLKFQEGEINLESTI